MASGILCGPRVGVAAGGGGGGGGDVVAVPDDSIYGLRVAKWKLGADGFIYRNGVRGSAWITPQVNMGAYEIRVDLGVGSDVLDINAGLGAWLSPVISPQWGYSNYDPKSGELDVQVRPVGGAVVDTATILLGTDGGDVPPRGGRDYDTFIP